MYNELSNRLIKVTFSRENTKWEMKEIHHLLAHDHKKLFYE